MAKDAKPEAKESQPLVEISHFKLFGYTEYYLFDLNTTNFKLNDQVILKRVMFQLEQVLIQQKSQI